MIPAAERAALEEVDFNLAPTPDDVWRASPYDVPAQHARAVDEILRGVNRARTEDYRTPPGVAVEGRSGAGKTHLLGAVRERIQRDGGYFFLVRLISGKTFWESTALCTVEGLHRGEAAWGTQLRSFLRRLTAQLGVPAELRAAIAGDAPLGRGDLDAFVAALRQVNLLVGLECQDTARALALVGSADFAGQDLGYAHLICTPTDPQARAAWGFGPAMRSPQQIVSDISQLVALTLSPSVIAVDQIDTLFAQSTATSLVDRAEGLGADDASVIGPVADGLINLRDCTRRTLVVLSCLPDTWVLLERAAGHQFVSRYPKVVLEDTIRSEAIARAIIAKRFAVPFARLATVPYATWPIKPEAFATVAGNLTPRELLRRVNRHAQWCLDRDEIVELGSLTDGGPVIVDGTSRVRKHHVTGSASLDERFAALVAAADVSAALDPQTEDTAMPELLAAGLAAWIAEQAPTGRTYKYDPPPGKKSALHARLIEVINEATENEEHWSFRAIASAAPLAVNNRIRAASTMAGLDHQVQQRRLVLLRNVRTNPWPDTPRAKEIQDSFVAAGGILHDIAEADLKVFAALKDMSARPDPAYHEWLTEHRPASHTGLFQAALPQLARTETSAAIAELDDAKYKEDNVATQTAQDLPSIPLGSTVDAREPFTLSLESLRRHCVIFAGSGSGKTVLIRRLVEECARQGVSAIVLDPNNDLARLGDPWPEPPAGWVAGDDARARDYLDHTDVVIWTPLVNAGRRLSFQPLPDFGPVRDSPDEFDQILRSTVEALAPRAGVHGTTKLAQRGKAVLTEALRAYAATGRIGLTDFTTFLAELPAGVSRMAKADKLAQEAAETLKAAMVTDPLFGGEGTAADPSLLLTPPPGKRARVSVISFVGLSSNEQRQGFVNQLQMALFGWIKRHPAGDRPLGGLLVMDEAQTLAPSTGKTPCTESTIALASQARKYGLGLVFATQAPKGLHNQISGNATTQFFGLLNAPVHIDAARELAAAKGGKLPDIGLLGSGQFYVAGEGFSFVKVNTPMCLTHHPKAPLPPDEVIQRSR